jgi:putative oxidoreductase
MQKIERYAPLAGRILLALIFLLSGLSKFTAWEQTAGYMASKGMPMIPFFLVSAATVELLAGLSVLLGFRARIGAAALILYLIPVSLIFHNFWALEGMEQQIQMVTFMKNLAIMGGLLLLVAFGSGALSLDNRRTSA